MSGKLFSLPRKLWQKYWFMTMGKEEEESLEYSSPVEKGGNGNPEIGYG